MNALHRERYDAADVRVCEIIILIGYTRNLVQAKNKLRSSVARNTACSRPPYYDKTSRKNATKIQELRRELSPAAQQSDSKRPKKNLKKKNQRARPSGNAGSATLARLKIEELGREVSPAAQQLNSKRTTKKNQRARHPTMPAPLRYAR